MENKVKNWLISVLVIALVFLAWSREDSLSARVQHNHDSLNKFGEKKPSAQKSPGAELLNETPFGAALTAGMEVMHQDMSNAIFTGEADRDFLATMIPHHFGAIEMSRLILLHGKNERVRRLAQGIIIEQQSEIEAMRRLLNETENKSPETGKTTK